MDEVKSGLVAVAQEFGGDALRDVWVFDQDELEPLYLREDVAKRIEDIDVEVYLDNERMGYVTRDTYEALTYAEYEYTVRGLSEFVQFRTFVPGAGQSVGVYVSFDVGGAYDFGELNERIHRTVEDSDEPLVVDPADPD